MTAVPLARGRWAGADLRNRAFDAVPRGVAASAGILSRCSALVRISGRGFNFLLESRRDRNRRLIAKLQSSGLDITLEEVETHGRTSDGASAFRARAGRKRLRE